MIGAMERKKAGSGTGVLEGWVVLSKWSAKASFQSRGEHVLKEGDCTNMSGKGPPGGEGSSA